MGKKKQQLSERVQRFLLKAVLIYQIRYIKKKDPIPNKSTTFNILLDNTTKPFMLNVLLNHSIGLNLLFYHDIALKLNVIPPTNN